MSRLRAAVVLALLMFPRSASAQAPTGAIVGVVRDATGGALEGVAIDVTNLGTGEHRALLTSAAGAFRADQMAAGDYAVTGTLVGFDTAKVVLHLDVGTRSADLTLQPSRVSDTSRVVAEAPRLDPERVGVATLIRRETIDALPLNGRNALDLVAIAPGGGPPVRASNNRLFVPTLGSGASTGAQARIGTTRVTIDGTDAGFIDAIGAGTSVSQDAVDSIQVSTSSFDPVTGLTADGAVNILTRSGSNDATGGVVGFWRDASFAAYPILQHDPANPDPAFERTQAGGFAGGALKKNRAFGFVDVEHTDQRAAVSVLLRPPFAALGGVGSSPFAQTLVTARADLTLGAHHHLTLETIDDRNHGISPGGAPVTTTLASGWAHTTNISSVNQLALTQVVSPTMVNDLRASYVWERSPEAPANAADCAVIGLPCLGLGGPTVQVSDTPNAPPLLQMGPLRTIALNAHREEVLDTFTWQRDQHRLRAGFDWEHNVATGGMDNDDPALIAVFTPATAAASGAGVPSAFASASDVLDLPLQSVQVSIGPAANLEKGSQPSRVFDSYRGFVADTWTIAPRVTGSASLAVSDEPNVLNTDLAKPAWLAPLFADQGPIGAEHLRPAVARPQWAPAAGLTWAMTRDARTIVRASAGRFVDPATATNSISLETERQALSPLGTGRLVGPISFNPLTGEPLQFGTPGALTGNELVTMLPAIRGALVPTNSDPSVLNIDATKAASDLTDGSFGQPSAIHVGVGIEREVGRTMVVGADGVWRRFSNTFILGIDENHWTSASGAVISACTAAQVSDLAAQCSNGPITFDATAGRARSLALLVHLDQRLARLQYTVAYTLSSYSGTNGTGPGTGFNLDNWLANDGPLPSDRRHVLDIAGTWTLPARMAISFNFAAASAPPFSAYLRGIDIDGDGTANDLLPGSTVGAFGRSLNARDLVDLVKAYNQEFATHAELGQSLPSIMLPKTFAFGDIFCTLDLRVTKTFGSTTGRMRLEAIAEVFNVLNTRNYTGYSGDLLNPATFGRPTALASQAFGTGGPRAGQFGLRLSF